MPHNVDVHAGSRLRALRAMRGMSQTQLANQLGLTFQQVQKYEKGANRISASKLYEISRILGVTPGYFFEGLEGTESDERPISDLRSARVAGFFVRIPEKETRDSVYSLLKSLAKVEEGEFEDEED